MNRIANAFAGRKAFIPFLTAGFPDVAGSLRAMHLLRQAGADVIELGYPFSDPTADGPVIQAASQAALRQGFHRADYFQLLRDFRREDQQTPLVVFSYCNPIHFGGTEAFVAAAAEAGADAFLVVDLPCEEQGLLRPALDAHGLHLIQLIAPTTTAERRRRILAQASGFVYQIARKGVTGARAEVSADLSGQVSATKAETDLPVAVGFGVSTGEQAAAIARQADGVIVGSALVQALADHPGDTGPFARLATDLAESIHA